MSTPVLTPVSPGFTGSGRVPPSERDDAVGDPAAVLGFNAIASMLTVRSSSLASPGLDAVRGSVDRATEVFSRAALVGKAPIRGGAAEIRYADEVARELAQPIVGDPLASPATANPAGEGSRRWLHDDRPASYTSTRGEFGSLGQQRDRSEGGRTETAASTPQQDASGRNGTADKPLTQAAAGATIHTTASHESASIAAPNGAAVTAANGASAQGGAGMFAALSARMMSESGNNARAVQSTLGGVGSGIAASQVTTSGTAVGAVAGVEGAGASPGRPGSGDAGGVYRGASTARSADDAQMEAQVVRGLSAVLKNGGGTVNLTLRPTYLGTLGVELNFGTGGITAVLRPTTAMAHELLKTSQAQLHAALEARGTRVESIVIEPPAEPGERPPANAGHDDRSGAQADDRSAAHSGQGDAHGGRADRSSQTGPGAGRASEDPTDTTDGTDGSERGAPIPTERDTDRWILGVDVVA